MDYISTLPVRVVDQSTPMFGEIVEKHRKKLFDSVLKVELVIPGFFKKVSND